MVAQSCSKKVLEIVLSSICIAAILIGWKHFDADKKPKDMEKSNIPGIAMEWSQEKRQWAYNSRFVLKPEEYQKYCGIAGEFCQFD